MTICDVTYCTSIHNLWEISDKINSPLQYKTFSVCDRCLNLREDFKDIHQALVRGRFDFQKGDEVTHDRWNLKKITVTWEKTVNPYWKCEECENTETIWTVVNPVEDSDNDQENDSGDTDTHFFCNQHLLRREFPRNLKIRRWNSDVGISTNEGTWFSEEKISMDTKKRIKCHRPGAQNPLKKNRVE